MLYNTLKMEKKLTAQGPKKRKSYTVTLPLEWVKERHLDKYKIIDMVLIGDIIILTPPSKTTTEKLSINADDFEKTLEKVIASLYIDGINEIKITYKKSETLRRITTVLEERLVGFEVTEQGKDYIIVKDIAKESEEKFKTVLRRIFLLILFLADEIQKNIEKKHYKMTYEIMQADKSINKLTNFCLRLLKKKGHTEHKKIVYYFNLCEEFERIGDEYKWLYQNVIKYKSEKEIKNNLKKLNAFLHQAHDIYYSFDVKKYDDRRGELYQFFEQAIKRNNPYQYFIVSIARRMLSLYGTIFFIRFNQK